MFHSSSREWLTASVLSQSADYFVAYLQERRFEAGTVRVYLHVAGHFGRWLTEQGLPLSAIDELLVKRFVGVLPRASVESRPYERPLYTCLRCCGMEV
jgi:site-specific recombinase XerD